MGIFTKKEKMNMKTGKFETTKKGLPSFRKQPTDLDQAVKVMEKTQRAKTKQKRKKEWNETVDKINKSRDKVGKYINPDILLPGGSLLPSSKKTGKKGKKGKTKYIIRGGKAYQVAGTGKQKKHKKKSKKDDYIDPFDMDLGGF